MNITDIKVHPQYYEAATHRFKEGTDIALALAEIPSDETRNTEIKNRIMSQIDNCELVSIPDIENVFFNGTVKN